MSEKRWIQSTETSQNLNPDLGLGVNFGSMVQQHFSNTCFVILCSKVQRRETVLFTNTDSESNESSFSTLSSVYVSY